MTDLLRPGAARTRPGAGARALGHGLGAAPPRARRLPPRRCVSRAARSTSRRRSCRTAAARRRDRARALGRGDGRGAAEVTVCGLGAGAGEGAAMCLIALRGRRRPRFTWRWPPTATSSSRADGAGRVVAGCSGGLAGRDRKAGGTWMGVTCGPARAALTNFRDDGGAERRRALAGKHSFRIFLEGKRAAEYVAHRGGCGFLRRLQSPRLGRRRAVVLFRTSREARSL